MGKAEVLSLLRDGEYVSGEEISRALGVTRTAVWKAVQALRADGCSIDSVPNRGYCLHRPESALSDAAVHALLEGCPWPINVLPTVDSTARPAGAADAGGRSSRRRAVCTFPSCCGRSARLWSCCG